MLRELPDCELTDNPDFERWLDEVQRAEGEEQLTREEQDNADMVTQS